MSGRLLPRPEGPRDVRREDHSTNGRRRRDSDEGPIGKTPSESSTDVPWVSESLVPVHRSPSSVTVLRPFLLPVPLRVLRVPQRVRSDCPKLNRLFPGNRGRHDGPRELLRETQSSTNVGDVHHPLNVCRRSPLNPRRPHPPILHLPRRLEPHVDVGVDTGTGRSGPGQEEKEGDPGQRLNLH